MNQKHPNKHYPWSQENPRDQLRVILGSVAGTLHNMQKGILTSRQIPEMVLHIEDALLLAAGLPKGEWESDPDGQKGI